MPPRTYDSSRWSHTIAPLTLPSGEELRIAYLLCPPPEGIQAKGTIMLIHGFPQTSHQFRHVITPLADAGYLVIAPDYRGAGRSSKPMDVEGYGKANMAADLHCLLYSPSDEGGGGVGLGKEEKVHVVGHDIGGKIAFAFAALYPEQTASLVWGECFWLGSKAYEELKTNVAIFHFLFHQILDLPEALISGKEDVYLRHFFDKQSVVADFLSPADIRVYVEAYKQPGAMRAGLNVYRTFEDDAKWNREHVKQNGKLKVRTMGLFAGAFKLREFGQGMVDEMSEGGETRVVERCGHYVPEERPERFVEEVLGFLGRVR